MLNSVEIRGKNHTAARPERSNARAKRVALSRGCSKAKPPEYHHPHEKRLKDANVVAKEADFRVFQTLFLGSYGIPRVTLMLHPRLRALGLSPSAFNLSGWIPSPPPRCNKKQSFHKHSTDKHNIVKICALIGRNLF